MYITMTVDVECTAYSIGAAGLDDAAISLAVAHCFNNWLITSSVSL